MSASSVAREGCIGVYEGLYSGEAAGWVIYKNTDHGVFAGLDKFPVARDSEKLRAVHAFAATLACAPRISDESVPPTLRHKLYTVATYTDRVLQLTNPDGEYNGQLVAGKLIRHPHVHTVVADPDVEWLQRFAKIRPRFELTDSEEDQRYATAYQDLLSGEQDTELGQQVQDLWRQCNAEIDEIGPTDGLTLAAMERLAVPLGSVAIVSS